MFCKIQINFVLFLYRLLTKCTGIKKPGFITSIYYLGEELPGLRYKDNLITMYNKQFFEKVFSNKRMERYFKAHQNEQQAILHYQCNIELSESFYISLSVFEVALRNALSRELQTMTGREDWYAIFPTTPGLVGLNKYITQAQKQIAGRNESIIASKVIAELTLGFWVSLLNSEYERILWKDLRRAFPYLPKHLRQRRNVSAPLNTLRTFRNRIFHNESICWNINRVEEIHDEIIQVMGWISRDIPLWIESFDRFASVAERIKQRMHWGDNCNTVDQTRWEMPIKEKTYTVEDKRKKNPKAYLPWDAEADNALKRKDFMKRDMASRSWLVYLNEPEEL